MHNKNQAIIFSLKKMVGMKGNILESEVVLTFAIKLSSYTLWVKIHP